MAKFPARVPLLLPIAVAIPASDALHGYSEASRRPKSWRGGRSPSQQTSPDSTPASGHDATPNETEGQSKGAGALWAIILGAIGAVGVVVSILINLNR